MDQGLDLGHGVSPSLAKLWPAVALGQCWPNISKCMAPANLPGGYFPMSLCEGNTTLVDHSLRADLSLAPHFSPGGHAAFTFHSHLRPAVKDRSWLNVFCW